MSKLIVRKAAPKKSRTQREMERAMQNYVDMALQAAYKDNVKPNVDLSEPPKKGQVLHDRTCPECGRKLVNLYRYGTDWKCKQCWEKEQTDA